MGPAPGAFCLLFQVVEMGVRGRHGCQAPTSPMMDANQLGTADPS